MPSEIVTGLFPFNAKRLAPSIETSVSIYESFTGIERRNANRAQYRRTFNASLGIHNLADVKTLIAFWNAMGGPLTGFLLKDFTDFAATSTAITLATGITAQGRSTLVPGETDIYQLEKWYTAGGITHKRKITRPKSTVTLSVSGTVDYTTGLVTEADSAPDWTGEFYVPCRFRDQALPMDLFLYYLNGEAEIGRGDIPDIPLIEILPC